MYMSVNVQHANLNAWINDYQILYTCSFQSGNNIYNKYLICWTAAAIQFKVDASWGTIKESMVGHLNKKIAREQKCAYSVSVRCFPRLPHPVTAQVRCV